MGQFLNKIRAKLGLEPRRDVTLTGKTPNEVIVSRATQNESVDPSAPGDKPVVLAPMRMSPPTPSHGIVVDKAMQLAKAHGAPHHIILTRSHDVIKKKTGSGVRNPLTPDQKLKHAKRFFPKANIQMASEERPNLLSQAADLHQKGHKHLIVVAGSDRVSEYQNLLNKYNGEAGKHGYFNFPKISVVAAGEQRDAAASGAAGWSGTKSRETVEAGNMKSFRKNAVPPHVSDKHAKELYDDLHNGMGLNKAKPMNEAGGDGSGYPVPAIPTRTARDFIGKKSTLNKLPPPDDKGNLGLDADLKNDKEQTNFELMRRRSKKRQLSVGFLEGYDDIEGIGALDTPKAPESNAPTTQAMKTSRIGGKRIKAEGLFAADIANGETGESGSANQSMDGVPVTAKEKTKLKDYKAVREACWTNYKQVGTKKKNGRTVPNCVPKEEVEIDEGVDKNHPIVKEYNALKKHDIKTLRGMIAQSGGVVDTSGFKSKDHAISHLIRAKHGNKKVDQAFGFNEEIELISERGEDKKGWYRSTESGAGITRKGAKAMGIKTAVTTPPSKLDPKGEAAGRRRSFCARMGGMKGPMKDEKGRPTRKAMSLRRWNCEEIQYDDGDEGHTQKAGQFHRGDRVMIKKDGYTGKGNIDMYDAASDSYVVATDKHGSNLHLKASEIEAIKEAKATPYVKPHVENGKQVGYKSSDGYHVKYWRLADSALEKAKQHAKVNTVSENTLTDRVKAIMEGAK